MRAVRLDNRGVTDVGAEVFGLDADASRWPRELTARFALARARLQGDIAFRSSLHEVLELPSYRDIIALGAEVAPLLVEDLATEDAPWMLVGNGSCSCRESASRSVLTSRRGSAARPSFSQRSLATGPLAPRAAGLPRLRRLSRL